MFAPALPSRRPLTLSLDTVHPFLRVVKQAPKQNSTTTHGWLRQSFASVCAARGLDGQSLAISRGRTPCRSAMTCNVLSKRSVPRLTQKLRSGFALAISLDGALENSGGQARTDHMSGNVGRDRGRSLCRNWGGRERGPDAPWHLRKFGPSTRSSARAAPGRSPARKRERSHDIQQSKIQNRKSRRLRSGPTDPNRQSPIENPYVVFDRRTPHPRLLRFPAPFGRLVMKAKGSVLVSPDVLFSVVQRRPADANSP